MHTREIAACVEARKKWLVNTPKRDGSQHAPVDHYSMWLDARNDGKALPGHGMKEQWKAYLGSWKILELG
jgi:hypothetical protein